MVSSKIVMFIGVPLEGGVVMVSGDLWRKMLNLKFPRKVESGGYLVQVNNCLVGRLHGGIFVSLGHQETSQTD